jgi:YD repeat-containing protein
MKQICCFVFLICALIFSMLATPTGAQTPAPCVVGQSVGFAAPTNSPQDYDCTNDNPDLPGSSHFVCNMRGPCPPQGSAYEFCLQCFLAAGQPISLSTGNTFIEETDVKIPGLSNGLSLGRTWNSMWPRTQMSSQVGLFGPNWRSTYEERVFTSGDGYMKYSRGDGNFWSFYYTGSAWAVVSPGNVTGSLVQGTSYWTLTFQNGEKRLFDINSGNLTSIIDRNGNTTLISYDSTGRLTTIADPGGRHLYFGYGSSSSHLVTSVTSDVGISLSYTYDTQGRLTQVTKPDLTTISFQYNTQSLISAVLDSSGVILESHTYDSFGRGLTSSRAGGVDAVTVSYPN